MSGNYKVEFVKCEGCGFDRLAYYDFDGEIEDIEDCPICEILRQKKVKEFVLEQSELPFHRADEMVQAIKGW